jgi:hypothetical protein
MGFRAKNPLVLCFCDEHVLVVLLPMPGGLPQRALQELRRVHLLVAGGGLHATDVGHEGLEQRPAVRVPEDRTGRVLLEMEQVHLAPEPAMVATLRLSSRCR